MSTETTSKIRDALERCERHKVDALTVLYRIDNLRGEVNSRYVFEHSTFTDQKVEEILS